MAEREGFEPSIELLTLYSLSRGAPSATRAPLRGRFLPESPLSADSGRNCSLSGQRLHDASEQPGCDIYGQRQDDRVEEER